MSPVCLYSKEDVISNMPKMILMTLIIIIMIIWHFHFWYGKGICLQCNFFFFYNYLFRSVQDPDFAEVLTDLNSRELFWLSRGQLEIAVATEGQDPRQISGFITGRKSCDSKCLLQSNTFTQAKWNHLFLMSSHYCERGIKHGGC